MNSRNKVPDFSLRACQTLGHIKAQSNQAMAQSPAVLRAPC